MELEKKRWKKKNNNPIAKPNIILKHNNNICESRSR